MLKTLNENKAVTLDHFGMSEGFTFFKTIHAYMPLHNPIFTIRFL